MYRDERSYREHLKDWYSGLLEEGWTLIEGQHPTFTKENYFIEFDPVILSSPDSLGMWLYKLDKGKLTDRIGIGTDQINESVFPLIELSDGTAFDVSTLSVVE